MLQSVSLHFTCTYPSMTPSSLSHCQLTEFLDKDKEQYNLGRWGRNIPLIGGLGQMVFLFFFPRGNSSPQCAVSDKPSPLCTYVFFFPHAVFSLCWLWLAWGPQGSNGFCLHGFSDCTNMAPIAFFWRENNSPDVCYGDIHDWRILSSVLMFMVFFL